MKWIVEGADGRSGTPVTLTIEAASEAEASKRAAAGGVQVVRVHEAGAARVGGSKTASGVAGERESAARVPCPMCAELVMPVAAVCPYCKHAIFSKRPGRNALIAVTVSVVGGLISYFAFTAFVHFESKREMDDITKEAEVRTDKLMKDAERSADEMMRRLAH